MPVSKSIFNKNKEFNKESLAWVIFILVSFIKFIFINFVS